MISIDALCHTVQCDMMVQRMESVDHLQTSTYSIEIPTSIKLDVYPIADILEKHFDFCWVISSVFLVIPRRHVQSSPIRRILNDINM